MKKKFKLITKKFFFNKNKNIEQDCNEKLSPKYNSFKHYNSKINFSYNLNNDRINSFKIINLKFKNRNHFQMFYFIIFSLINCLLAEKVFNYRNLNNDNSIKLIIYNGGMQKVLGSNVVPDEVYLNGKLTRLSYSSNISIKKNNEGNEIILVWKKKLKSCENLFESCYNIVEIDLSNFDASEVTSMVGMFSECSNLDTINFGNFNTSSVTNMSKMFYHCDELTQLDLRMFKTPKLKSMEYSKSVKSASIF